MIFILTALAGMAQTDSAANDSAYNVLLRTIVVKARWKNDTERYRYNQEKFYVTTVMPYVNAATALFKDVNAKMEDESMGRKERKRYIGMKEDEMRTQFEDKVKNLNVTQGVLLVKLIARQTDINIYKMLVKFKNPIVALKWQTWARLNGMNLDKRYHPEDEPMLENIMEELGYPLPGSYSNLDWAQANQ